MNGLAPVVNPPDGAATGGMTALIFHLVVTGVLLPAFVDYVRHKMTAGPTLLRWQPSVSCYYGALRRHGDRPPLDALLVITAGYIALVFVGNPTWQLHVLFALLAVAALMPPLYWVSERGVLILRPRLPWRRELSPWQFRWDEVERVQLEDDGIVVHLGSRWLTGPPHRRLLVSDDPKGLLALVPTLVPNSRRPAEESVPEVASEKSTPEGVSEPAPGSISEATPADKQGEPRPVDALLEEEMKREPSGELHRNAQPGVRSSSVPPPGSDGTE